MWQKSLYWQFLSISEDPDVFPAKILAKVLEQPVKLFPIFTEKRECRHNVRHLSNFTAPHQIIYIVNKLKSATLLR